MSLDMTGGRSIEHVESARATRGKGKKAGKKPSQGQSGPKLTLTWEKLTTNERRVLKSMLPAPGEHRKPMTIGEIAAETGWIKRQGQSRANSWVRNQLRRLVRADLVEHAEKIKDGRYILTDVGKRLARTHIEHKQPERKHEPVVEQTPPPPAQEPDPIPMSF